MDELWTRLETFLQLNAPQIYAGLAPAATEAEIADTEARCGFSFPPDVRRSYLRHNGQLLDEQWAFAGGTFIPSGCGLFPLADILDRWQSMADGAKSMETMEVMPFAEGASPGIQPVFVSQRWLPFAADISGNYLCLDFDPTPVGTLGQIVEFNHEAEGQRCLAPSFRVWLEMIVGDLETGRLVWNTELEGYEYPEET